MLLDKKNLFANIPELLSQESFETLLTRDGIRLERIISHGHTTPAGEWYDQPWDEWVVLLSGSASLQFEGEEPLQLIPGDYLFIPARCRHRVEATDKQVKSVWLALHLNQDV